MDNSTIESYRNTIDTLNGEIETLENEKDKYEKIISKAEQTIGKLRRAKSNLKNAQTSYNRNYSSENKKGNPDFSGARGRIENIIGILSKSEGEAKSKIAKINYQISSKQYTIREVSRKLAAINIT